MTATVYWAQFDTGDGTTQAVMSDYSDSYIISSTSSYKARPSSDVAAGTWLPSTPAAPLYSMLDESVASDSDYIYTNSPDSIAQVGLQSVAQPEAGTGWVLRVRAKSEVFGRYVRIKLMQGATEIASWERSLTSSYQTFELPLSTDQKAAITDLSTLSLKYEAIVKAPERLAYWEADASAGDLSASNVVPAGTNLCVAFWEHWDNNGGSTATALTLGGQPMTILTQSSELGGLWGVGIALLATNSFPTGSQTHTLTWSGGGARLRGGRVFYIYFQGGNVADPYRVFGTGRTATNYVDSPVPLAGTLVTDRVVGFAIRSGTFPYLSGVPRYAYANECNIDYPEAGDATGLSGTVSIGMSIYYQSVTAGISLKGF